jgi:hypothetical protein
MLTVVETPVFQSMVEAIWTPSEHEDFAVFIGEHPFAGDVIPQTGGLRKLRWLRQGIVKAKFDNIPAQVLNTWKKAYDEQA